MATTIDSLQIEIQSSSANAAAGIKELALSMGELKKNGTVNVAVKNLNNLRNSLRAFSNIPSSASKITSLARAMETLKNVGSVSSIANSLTKLSSAMKSVGSLDLGGVDNQILGIVDAVRPLSEVRSGGLSTMVNALGKLGSVTDSLDDEAIAKFADRVKKLTDALEPLSTQMTTIQAGLRNVNTNARRTSTSVLRLGEDVNVTALNMSNFITVAQGIIQALEPVIRMITEAVSAAIEWDGIAARFGRGFGGQAQEVYAWVQRLNEEMGLNIQQFMQYSSVYSTMLTGFGVAVEDATKMALGYTELTYDIWAGYNDIYANFADAAEAVKSAIAGEVEPIRRAGFTIVESTLEQTAANHGLNISLEKATEAQKSYLRYLTLVDQAHAQGLVGTYAKELNTAEGLMRTFSQQLKSLAQAFGSLFLPALTAIMPYLQAFVELLTDAIRAVASFFGIEIQAVDWSGYNEGADAVGGVADSAEAATGALGEAAKAAKELKNATIGIDELNVISPPTSSSGSGGSGGAGGAGGGFDDLDIDSLWDESIFDNIQSQVDELKEKIKGFLPVVGGIAAAFAGWSILNLLDDLDLADGKLGKMKGTIEGLAKGLVIAGISVAVGKLVWDFTGAYLEGGSFSDLAKALGTTVLGTAVAAWLTGKVGAGIVLITSGVITLTRLGVELKEGTIEITDPEALVTGLVGALETVLGGALLLDALNKGKWSKAILGSIKGALTKATTSAAFSSLSTTVSTAISTALGKVGALLAGVSGWAVAAVAAVVGLLVLSFVEYDFTEIGHTIGEGIGKALKTAVDWAADVGAGILDGLEIAIDWVKDNLDIDDFWDVLKLIFVPGELKKKLDPLLDDLFDKVSVWIEERITNLKENINEFFGGFFDGLFDGMGVDVSWAERFLEFFDIEYLDIVDMIIDPRSIGKHIMTGISKGMDENEKLSGIKDKLSGMWTTAKNWWDNSKPKLSSYTPGIGSILNNLKTAWTNAKTWYEKNKGSLKTYTPNIGSIYEKLKVRWDNARDWYNNKKSKLKEYTPSIGSIYEKVKARWDNARSWYNSKKSGMNSYTPSIGSIKDKLVSAWNTAKSWWNKNVKLSIPSLSFKVTYSTPSSKTMKAIMEALDLPGWPKLSFAAGGGIFDQGSMIWAGERGPEVVANAAGGKTGVMNVQQMQDAVYEGVYAAVVAAMRGSNNGGNQPVIVYLDGRQLTHTVEKTQRERGASIMGAQMYGY